MAESTLSYDYDRLRREIGRDIGYGRDPSAWIGGRAYRATDVSDAISAGLTRFYSDHSWQFLKPVIEFSLNAPYSTGTIAVSAGVVTLTGGTFPTWAASGELVVEESYSVAVRNGNTQLTLSDTTVNIDSGTSYSLVQTSYPLPDDFDGFESEFLVYRSANDSSRQKIKIIHLDAIRDLAQYFDYTNFVTRVAVAPRVRGTSAIGDRMDLRIWPSPSAAGRLIGRYRIKPDMLTGTNKLKYPYGGPQHGPTIEAICKHEASRRFDRTYDGRYLDEYLKVLLPKSMKRDADAYAPKSLGFDLGCGRTYTTEEVTAMTVPYGVPYEPFETD